jgi:hypothetical protein
VQANSEAQEPAAQSRGADLFGYFAHATPVVNRQYFEFRTTDLARLQPQQTHSKRSNILFTLNKCNSPPNGTMYRCRRRI